MMGSEEPRGQRYVDGRRFQGGVDKQAIRVPMREQEMQLLTKPKGRLSL